MTTDQSQREEEVAVKAVQKRLLYTDMEKKSVGAEIDNQLRIVHKWEARNISRQWCRISLHSCP